jgi:hypothetical protein
VFSGKSGIGLALNTFFVMTVSFLITAVKIAQTKPVLNRATYPYEWNFCLIIQLQQAFHGKKQGSLLGQIR